MRSEFSEASVPDLHGKTIVVTGGNSGIGFEAGVVFARRGAETILACRDPKRAEGALTELRRLAPGADARAMRLDLADLGSVRDFADKLAMTNRKLDVLVNNAGVMGLPSGRTPDGFESHIGTNHFGHFVLTLRLLPLLESAPSARVVTVSSLTHRGAKLDLEDIDMVSDYSPSRAYAASKLANLLFAYELERKLRLTHRRTVSIACHPGMAATQITQGTSLSRMAPWLANVLVWGNGLVAQPAHMGAWPTLFAAVEDVPGAAYVGPSQLFGTRGVPAVMQSSAASRDEGAAKKLWSISEHRTGEFFPY